MSWATELAQRPALALGALAALVLVLLVVLVWQLNKARLAVSSTPTPDELPDSDGALTYVDLRADPGIAAGSLDRALALMRRASPGGDPYAIPWFLLLGQTAAGKTTLLDLAGLPLPFGAPAAGGVEPTDGSAPRPAALAWVFDAGVVLDVLGSLVLRLDGDSSDEEGWLDLLRALRRARPRRPIDGVMVAIPAAALLQGTTAEARQAAAAAPAARLFSKLLQAEVTLGMSFPVDVLVTESDQIPGFTSFAQGLPSRTLGQIFGWSNPQPLDAPYQPSWVSEAYTAINSRLLELLGAAPSSGLGSDSGSGSGSAAADFPASLAATQPAAQVYLNHLFSAAGLGEPFSLRGLYFCGGRFAAAGSEAACCDGPEAVLFVRDLLADKVMVESAIAQPTAAAVAARSRRSRRLLLASAVLALLGVAALGWGYRSVKAQADALIPPVETLGAGPGPEGENWARKLLRQSQGLTSTQPRSLFLPSSWIAPLHARIGRTFDAGYQQLLEPVSRQVLTRRLKELELLPARPLPLAPATSSPAIGLQAAMMPAVPETPEFKRLSGFVSGVTDLEAAAEDFSCLGKTCSSCPGKGCADGRELVAQFDDMASYLYQEKLSPPNLATEAFYGGVMRSLSFPPWPYLPEDQRVLQDKTTGLTHQLYTALFRNNAVLASLDRLVADLARVEIPFGLTSPANVETYQRLDAELAHLARQLDKPQIQWMGGETLELGPEMDAVYAAIGQSHYLAKTSQGEDLERELRKQADAGFLALQIQLLEYHTKATGPVLARQGGHAQLKLSEGTRRVKKAVKEYLGEKFIEPEQQSWLKMPLDWQRLLWNTDLLEQAAALVPPYRTYVDKELITFPPDMRTTAQQVALESLEAAMMELIAKAQELEKTPWASTPEVPPLLELDLANRAANFTTASPVLAEILGDFIELELAEAYWELAKVVERQELQLLVDDSQLLALHDLYSPKSGGFGWWDGLKAPAPAAFGASDAKGLTAYLAQELAIVTRLAETYAQPVIALVQKEPAIIERDPDFQAELDRWGLILTQLGEAKSQKAGNAVANLETFISGDLGTVTLPSCFAEPLPATVDGYFEERQADLEEELRDRCTELAKNYGYACYQQQLAPTFNQQLGGRFPFARFDALPAGAEAEPEALAGFFALYDAYAWLYMKVPPGADLYGDQAGPVAAFLAENEPVRKFLAPFLDDLKTYPVPQWGFTVEFRVNPNGERGAEDVIGWSLAIGGKNFERSGTVTSGTWAYNSNPATLTPTLVALRWAENSPRVPIEPLDPGQIERWGVARLESRTAIFQYDDPWSLVALLLDRRYLQPGSRLQPETLEFKIQTGPAPVSDDRHHHQGATAPAVGPLEADLFLRLSLTTPDGKQPIDLPPVFPVTAPEVPPHFEQRVCPTFGGGS